MTLKRELDPEKLGNNLKVLIDILGVSRTELSEKTEISPDTLTQIMSGTRQPDLKTLCTIANCLGAKVDRLLS